MLSVTTTEGVNDVVGKTYHSLTGVEGFINDNKGGMIPWDMT